MPKTLQEGARVPLPIPPGVGEASSQGLHHYEGLHPYHPRPIGQGLEACLEDYRPGGQCPGGRQRVPEVEHCLMIFNCS
jgi:hypothetical protein